MLDTNGEVRVGLVGFRGRGPQLGRLWREVEGARLVAVADMVPEQLDDAGKEFGDVELYPDHASMLEGANLDILTVGTAAHFRPPIIRDAAAGGIKGIYAEKPIANSLAEADEMIATCKASGTVLTIGHQRRWMSPFIQVRDAIRDGAIGRPTHGLSYWTAGRIGSNGTHFLDMVNFVMDSDPIEVAGTAHFGVDSEHTDYNESLNVIMAQDPSVMGYVKYANGARHMVYCMPDVLLPHTHMFCGSRGRIDMFEPLFESGPNILYRARDEDTRDMREGAPVKARELKLDPFERADGEKAGFRELMGCIDTGSPSTSSGEDGRLVLEVIVAFRLSSEAGGAPVSLPLPDSALSYKMDLH